MITTTKAATDALTAASAGRMMEARAHYMGVLGFAVVPIHPKRKKPVEGLTDWQLRRLDSQELDRHIRNGCGLGVVHGLSGTAALDADMESDFVARALKAVGVDFRALQEAGSPAIVGNPAKPPKLIFRVPAGYDLSRRVLNWPKRTNPNRVEVVLELRAGPVQDVLPPTPHPDTDEPYEWIGGPPSSREDLPLIPGPLLGLWLAWDQLRPAMEAACPWAERPAPAHPPRPRNGRSYEGPSIIEAWNEGVPPSVILERNGYKPDGRDRWICPGSTSGDAGVVALDERVYSHHASDLLGDGHAHDAFDVLRLLEHNGNAKEAARSAALELGLDLRPRSEPRERAARARAALSRGEA
jgi:putative DNA primase/helicase